MIRGHVEDTPAIGDERNFGRPDDVSLSLATSTTIEVVLQHNQFVNLDTSRASGYTFTPHCDITVADFFVKFHRPDVLMAA